MRPLRLFVTGFVAFLIGCGSGNGNKNTLVPVKGTVKLPNGNALSGGQITFRGDGTNPTSVSGGINGNGQYEVAVPAGEYKVTVDNS
ncbi:MAG TPA: carboxypeptidase-like regulatory domain-containing protein, partial [Urbifossiella sp.]|nr:carboxypeptidase-like regulatory domain-containing protein [Urbifossiella sp.]